MNELFSSERELENTRRHHYHYHHHFFFCPFTAVAYSFSVEGFRSGRVPFEPWSHPSSPVLKIPLTQYWHKASWLFQTVWVVRVTVVCLSLASGGRWNQKPGWVAGTATHLLADLWKAAHTSDVTRNTCPEPSSPLVLTRSLKFSSLHLCSW